MSSSHPPSSSPQSPAESTAEARATGEGPFQESQVTITYEGRGQLIDLAIDAPSEGEAIAAALVALAGAL